MEERMSTASCERGNDLIAFLYDEISDSERQDFEQHLAKCAGCKGELEAFRGVREYVIDWRRESLGLTSAHSLDSVRAFTSTTPQRKPSAIAAIRGFFQLSPLWMKAALASAVLVFCVMAALTFARFGGRPTQVVIADSKIYSEKELQIRIEEVKAKLQSPSTQKSSSDAALIVKTTKSSNSNRPRGIAKESAVNLPKTKRAPLTRSEREQLAADLRLINPNDDTRVDLLGEGINQ